MRANDSESRLRKIVEEKNLRTSFFVLHRLDLRIIQERSRIVSKTCGQVHRQEECLFLLQAVECEFSIMNIQSFIVGHLLVFFTRYGPGESEIVVVSEVSPTPDPKDNPRSARLLGAEKVVLENGGGCLRLAGLYTMERGAHNFWLTSGKDVSGRDEGIINLLHYDDAAGAAMAAVLAGPVIVSGNVFLISDGNPLTRRQICESTLKSKQYQGMKMPKFLGSDSEPIGKIYDGSASNKALKWDPKYRSFDSFMTSYS